MKTPCFTPTRPALIVLVLTLLAASLWPASRAGAQEPELAPCGPPPAAANWTINASCEISANTIAPRNVTITNNATVAIFGGRWLNVDFTNYYLRILPGSKLLIRPGARLYTLPLGHTFLNNSDGVFGYYLKRVNGAVMESYNPTFAFYPASTIKVVQHLQIMLNETNDNSLLTAINAIVDQEAALIEMPAADT